MAGVAALKAKKGTRTRLPRAERRAGRKREMLPVKIESTKEAALAREEAAARWISRAVAKRDAHVEQAQQKGERLQRKLTVHEERTQRIGARDVRRIERRGAKAERISAKDSKKLERLHQRHAALLQNVARMTDEASALTEVVAKQRKSLEGIDARLASLNSSPFSGPRQAKDERKALISWRRGLVSSMATNEKLVRGLEHRLLKSGYPRGRYYPEVEDLRGHQEFSKKTRKVLGKSAKSTS
jgi:hypothetical protein